MMTVLTGRMRQGARVHSSMLIALFITSHLTNFFTLPTCVVLIITPVLVDRMTIYATAVTSICKSFIEML